MELITQVSFYLTKDQGGNLGHESNNLSWRLKAVSKTMSKSEQTCDTV